MKIFAYLGNQKGEASGTYKIVKEFISRLSEKIEIEYVVYSPKNSNIQTC